MVFLFCIAIFPACQTFYCDAVAFHFSKVKGSMELVESIHSLLYKSKGKVSLLECPLRWLYGIVTQRHSIRSSHIGRGSHIPSKQVI